MIQDIAPHTLANDFHPLSPQAEDLVLLFDSGCLLTAQAGETLEFARLCDLRDAGCYSFRYLFAVDGAPWFLAWPQKGADVKTALPARFVPQPVSFFRTAQPRQKAYAVVTAFHLYNWYDTTRFCGRCGQKLIHDEKERMMRCTVCGNLIFPRISPSVIVALTDGERILMTRYANRAYTRWALVAGFTEIGETPEETVRREVSEEVGLQVKNIRYYKSQPWGFTGGLLMGFFCELAGPDTITLDTGELSHGEWVHRRDMDDSMGDDGVSLTREMMRVFREDGAMDPPAEQAARCEALPAR